MDSYFKFKFTRSRFDIPWSVFYSTPLARILFKLGYRWSDQKRWVNAIQFRAIVGRSKWYDKFLLSHLTRPSLFQAAQCSIIDESRPGKQYQGKPPADPYDLNLQNNAEALVREGYGEYIEAMMKR